MHSDTSGTEPPQPLFELTPLTAEQAEAYSGLLDYGCQVVLCSSKKSPTWIGWQKKTPTYDDLWHHDGPIALIPASRHLVVFDCDSGTPDDIAAFAREYPPIVQLPSRQPGRWHFFYPATRLIKNSWFGWRSVSGDVRSQAGYVVLWRDNAQRLLEALMDPNPTSTQAPLHLIQKTPPQTRAKPAPQRTSTSDPEPPRGGSGSPGPIHFDQLRNWAYRTPRGTDREAWDLRVADESRRLNEDLPVPLTLAEVEYTAAAVAEWVWNKMPAEYLAKGGEWTTDLARQKGLASGAKRRKGTALEHDRTPWVAEGISRRTWLRRRASTSDAPTIPKTAAPHLALGISPDAWRQRLSRTRAGTYRGAKKGVHPWDYLAIGEAEWWEYYAPGAPCHPAPEPAKNCHKFGTEQIGGQRDRRDRREGIGGGVETTGDPGRGVGPAPEKPQQIKMSSDQSSDQVSRPVTKKVPTPKEGVDKKADIDSKSKAAMRKMAKEIIVDEYLSLREAAYELALLHCGGIPHGLRRPMMPYPEYDRSNAKHRQKYAIAMSEKAKHDLGIAEELYAREHALGLVPRGVPPWREFTESWVPDDILVEQYLQDRREWISETRHFWRRELAGEYAIDQAVLLDRDKPTRNCLAAECRQLAQESDVLCNGCRGLASALTQCPHCGESESKLLLAGQRMCPTCTMATPEQLTTRTNALVVAWDQLRTETFRPPVQRHHLPC